MARLETVAAQSLPMVEDDTARFRLGRRIERRRLYNHYRNGRFPAEETG
jgi:hypothetical protein